VTVPLIAHYGAGNPADPQKIILDPSRGGAVRLGEGECNPACAIIQMERRS
jgi:hypothetical protein